MNELLTSSVFLAGFLSFFSPCTFSLMPAYIGIITDQKGEYKSLNIGNVEINIGAILKTISFILGISTSFVILGFGAGLFGSLINRKLLMVVGGAIVFILGLHQMEIINIERLNRTSGINFENNKTKALGTYLMGVSFSIGWTPCVGPVLGAVLLASATAGTKFYGAFMMLIYSIGLMIPFLIMSIFSSALVNNLKVIRKHLEGIKKFGGLLICIMGLILMTNQLPALNRFFNSFFI